MNPTISTNEKKIIIFTDLDGTLLDHNDYSYTAAIPCLEVIRKYNLPLIFTSSKTAVEIEEFCNTTNFYHPYISENGGLLSVPKNYFTGSKSAEKKYDHQLIGISRDDIINILTTLQKSYKFSSFSKMSTDEIARLTGLNNDQAFMASQRQCSEPILWQDSNEKFKTFSNTIEESNLQILSGGRFLHIMGKHDKATTMSHLLDQYKSHFDLSIISIALGDSPNDHKMLITADYGILIPNPNAPKQCLDNHENLIYANTPGPQGWNDELLKLLKEIS